MSSSDERINPLCAYEVLAKDSHSAVTGVSANFDFDNLNSSKVEKQGIEIQSVSAVLKKFDRVARCHGGGGMLSSSWAIRPARFARRLSSLL